MHCHTSFNLLAGFCSSSLPSTGAVETINSVNQWHPTLGPRGFLTLCFRVPKAWTKKRHSRTRENLWLHTFIGPLNMPIESEAVIEEGWNLNKASDWISMFKGPNVCRQSFCHAQLHLMLVHEWGNSGDPGQWHPSNKNKVDGNFYTGSLMFKKYTWILLIIS